MYDERRKRNFDRGPREMHDVTCADCGVETQVPFKPDGTRPVYCRECYQKRRPSRYQEDLFNIISVFLQEKITINILTFLCFLSTSIAILLARGMNVVVQMKGE